MRKNLKKETKKKVIKKIKQNTKRIKNHDINYLKNIKKIKLNKMIFSGGFVIDIPPIDLEKLGPVEIIHTLIKKILTVFLTKSVKNIPASSAMSGKTIDNIVDDILEHKVIKFKINTLASKIVSQIHLTMLMTVNAIISFIPVPIIPGLIRDATNGIYNLVKIINKLNEFKNIKNEIIGKLKEDGIEIDEISPINLVKQSIEDIRDQAKILASKQLELSKKLELPQELMQATDKMQSLQSQATDKMKGLQSQATSKMQGLQSQATSKMQGLQSQATSKMQSLQSPAIETSSLNKTIRKRK